jgi:hypothetical protein
MRPIDYYYNTILPSHDNEVWDPKIPPFDIKIKSTGLPPGKWTKSQLLWKTFTLLSKIEAISDAIGQNVNGVSKNRNSISGGKKTKRKSKKYKKTKVKK